MNIGYSSNFASIVNPKARRKKFGIGSLVILLAVGTAFTFGGLLLVKNSKIDPSWQRVNGQVVDSSSNISSGSTTYTPVVKYQVDGRTYQVTSNTSSSLYPRIGELKEVAYNPAGPQEAKVVDGAGTAGLLYLFVVLGIGSLILAPVLFVRSLRRGSNIHNLMQSGQKLQGIIIDVQSIGTDNNNLYKILVSATDTTGQVTTFTSDTLTGIGGLAMADFRRNPIPIDVYVNPSNPAEYYVDVSEVPNLTPERIIELIKSATKSHSLVGSEQPNSVLPSSPAAGSSQTSNQQPPTIT